jgi:hypothetical protein
MRTTFKSEAEKCRHQAAKAFSGKPEGPFLLRLATIFDELAREPAQEWPRQPRRRV